MQCTVIYSSINVCLLTWFNVGVWANDKAYLLNSSNPTISHCCQLIIMPSMRLPFMKRTVDIFATCQSDYSNLKPTFSWILACILYAKYDVKYDWNWGNGV